MMQAALTRELSVQFDLDMHTPTEHRDREESDVQPALVTERTL